MSMIDVLVHLMHMDTQQFLLKFFHHFILLLEIKKRILLID